MAISVTKGYTFGSTEMVTSTKLHTLVDSSTVNGAALTPYSITFTSGSLTSGGLVTIPHSLGTQYCGIAVWHTVTKAQVTPTSVTCQDSNNLLLQIGASFASLCQVKVFP
jgi:hypothetical protein